MSAQVEPAFLFWSNMADILFLNTVGIVVCLYALHVELSKEKNPKYRAMCDFNEHMSCSRVLTSEYSQGFGMMHVLFGKNHFMNARNCNIGLVIYIANILICVFLPAPLASTIMYYCAIVSVVGCVYLAFILFVILKDICVVCMSMYVINGTLLFLTYNMHKVYHS